MPDRHYVCDYEITRKGKVVKTGSMQFARVKADEFETDEEAFAEIRPQFENSGLRLKPETFREVKAVAPLKTDAKGNIVERPTVIETPSPAQIIVPPGVPAATPSAEASPPAAAAPAASPAAGPVSSPGPKAATKPTK